MTCINLPRDGICIKEPNVSLFVLFRVPVVGHTVYSCLSFDFPTRKMLRVSETESSGLELVQKSL